MTVRAGHFRPSSDVSGAATPAKQLSGLTSFVDATGEHVYYIGTNEHILDAKSGQDLTLKFGTPTVGANNSLASFSNSLGQHVYFVDSIWHVNQINLNTGLHLDLTKWTSATPFLNVTYVPSSSPTPANCAATLTSFSNLTGEHVYWIGDDFSVHQFYFSTNVNSWYDQNLTAAGQGPVPAGGCVIYQ